MVKNESVCLRCGETINDQTPVDGEAEPPGDGDISIGVYCAAVAVYVIKDNVMTVRTPTEEEAGKIADDETIQEALAYLGLGMGR